MLNKLEVLEDKYKDLSEKIADPEIINDQKVWQKLIKEHADLEPIIMKFREYKEVKNSIAESKEILQEESDEELRELAKMELAEMEDKLETLELRKQTMTRQEERVMKKLEEMQSTIQNAMQGMGQ